MSGYQRRLCSNCGEGLGFSESDPCDRCREQAEFVGGLFAAIIRAGGVPVDLIEPSDFGCGPDLVGRQSHEQREKA
jgi:hypothetical protein